jgi:hypothetical protein
VPEPIPVNLGLPRGQLLLRYEICFSSFHGLEYAKVSNEQEVITHPASHIHAGLLNHVRRALPISRT